MLIFKTSDENLRKKLLSYIQKKTYDELTNKLGKSYETL